MSRRAQPVSPPAAVPTFNPVEWIAVCSDKLVTGSRKLADAFGRRHKDVLKAYDRLRCSAEFNRRNFAPVEYLDAKGQMRREILMTKNGMVFLAMGFTGDVADAIKEAYIEAFDAMAAMLSNQANTAWRRYDRAQLAYQAAAAEASHFGRGLSQWGREVKPAKLAELAALELQLPLLLPGGAPWLPQPLTALPA